MNKGGDLLHIREAKASDAAALATLSGLLGQSLDAVLFEQDIARYAKVFFVADWGDVVAGYLVLREEPAPSCVQAQSPIQLWRLYVAPAFHGQGVASGLMAQAFASSRKWGHDAIWLGTGEDNARAIAFYNKHGFKPLGLAHLHAGHDEHEDLIMIWKAQEL